jgi:uncharacterized protein (UPF0218 family)
MEWQSHVISFRVPDGMVSESLNELVNNGSHDGVGTVLCAQTEENLCLLESIICNLPEEF